MLELPDRLPPGALCAGADAALAHDLATTGALWWHGRGAHGRRHWAPSPAGPPAWAPAPRTRPTPTPATP